jgi:hypothetical protein
MRSIDEMKGLACSLSRARAFQVDVGRKRLDVCLCKGGGKGGGILDGEVLVSPCLEPGEASGARSRGQRAW